MTDRLRTPRTLLIPDHVWQAYELMAADMGSERDGLVSQALFAFARMNGYLVPHDLQRLGLSSPPPPSAEAPNPISPVRSDPPPRAAPLPRAAPRIVPPALAAASSAAVTLDPEPAAARRPTANPERMAELERQLQAARPTPSAANGSATIEVDDALLGDDGVQATSMELPNLRELGLMPERKPASMSAASSNEPARGVEVAPSATPTLVISTDGRELDRVLKERFLIGRGKHCDLIINSGKVSREHAAITREGGDYFIEDLGSSNGTWFDKRRITKRQIQEGDEYFICAEKLACKFTS